VSKFQPPSFKTVEVDREGRTFFASILYDVLYLLSQQIFKYSRTSYASFSNNTQSQFKSSSLCVRSCQLTVVNTRRWANVVKPHVLTVKTSSLFPWLLNLFYFSIPLQDLKSGGRCVVLQHASYFIRFHEWCTSQIPPYYQRENKVSLIHAAVWSRHSAFLTPSNSPKAKASLAKAKQVFLLFRMMRSRALTLKYHFSNQRTIFPLQKVSFLAAKIPIGRKSFLSLSARKKRKR